MSCLKCLKCLKYRGIHRTVLDKILIAAKNPQLESKLQNMPVPLTADWADQYMGPVRAAAWSGDLDKIVRRD